ncbi:MAG: hypothetical protein JWN34_2760 [Bryobacterales bacterium]|nr:hypothetical protein [Bryobacterales bacterium]
MSTAKQILANQANAAHSTGPRTEAGKANTRLNGLKHGLTGLMRLMPDEDQADYVRHCEGIVESLVPENELELRVAQSIADDYWRIDRIRRMEQLLLMRGYDQVEASIENGKQLSLYNLYESRLNRNVRNNLAELRKIQADRRARVTETRAQQTTPEHADRSGSQPIGSGFSFPSIPHMIEAEMAALGATRLHDVSEFDPANYGKAA